MTWPDFSVTSGFFALSTKFRLTIYFSLLTHCSLWSFDRKTVFAVSFWQAGILCRLESALLWCLIRFPVCHHMASPQPLLSLYRTRWDLTQRNLRGNNLISLLSQVWGPLCKDHSLNRLCSCCPRQGFRSLSSSWFWEGTPLWLPALPSQAESKSIARWAPRTDCTAMCGCCWSWDRCSCLSGSCSCDRAQRVIVAYGATNQQ